MSFESLKAAIKSVFNSPEEEVERHIRADESNDEMSISKGLIENICLNALVEGVKIVRLRESSLESATVFFLFGSTEKACGELPLVQSVYLAKRIRVMANIDGWGHLETTPYEMEVSANDQDFLLRVKQFKLKPELDILMEVHPVVRS